MLKFHTLLIMSFLPLIGYGGRNDIIFLLDKNAAGNQGHIAILIGNEIIGWHYVSINGTGDGAKPWGISLNADIGTSITDSTGKIVHNPRKAIHRANIINPYEKHTYDFFRRIETSISEDNIALNAAKNVASAAIYGIIGPGQSCIDVAQAAFGAVVKARNLDKNGSVPGQIDLIPKNWFRKLDNRVRQANSRLKGRKNSIKFTHPLNKKNRIVKHPEKLFIIPDLIQKKRNKLSTKKLFDIKTR